MITLTYSSDTTLESVVFTIDESGTYTELLEHYRRFLVCCGYADYGPLEPVEDEE